MTAPVVYLTDKDLRPVTDPIRWTAIDATARYLEPGHGQVTCPAYPQLMSELQQPGRRAVLVDDGRQFLAGPVERPYGPYQWSGDGPGTVAFHFTDDLAVVVGRRVFPDPSRPWAQQSLSDDAYYVTSGRASSVLLRLANLNAGPGAIAARRVPRLVMGADPLAGPTISVQSRFKPLGDELRAAVTAAGDTVGFRTTSTQSATTFEVYATVDRSKSVRFSRGLGNLRAVTFETETPRVTAALVAAQGQGTARTLIERVNTAAEFEGWRVEDFLDRRDSDDDAVLRRAGDELLVEGGAGARLATVTVDTPDQRYGTHYRLGDRAGTEPIAGLIVPEVVRAVHLQATPKRGVLRTAMVGSQAMARDPGWLRMSRELARRLDRLETI